MSEEQAFSLSEEEYHNLIYALQGLSRTLMEVSGRLGMVEDAMDEVWQTLMPEPPMSTEEPPKNEGH